MSKNCLSSAAFALIAASHYDETRYQILFQAPCNSPARGFFIPSNIPIFPTSLESFPFAVGKYTHGKIFVADPARETVI